MPQVYVVLVIPCYNEERRLPVETLRGFDLPGCRFEILFVNDGSTDGTLAMLQSLAAGNPARYSVVDLERNSGKAEAVRMGMLAAMERQPDFAGFWDADLATPLSELPAFLEIFTSRDAIDFVMGARVRLLGRSISRNPARHYFGRVGATLISSSLGLAVYDTQCGAKVLRVNDSTRELFADPFLSRWIFDVEIIARMVRQRGRDATAAAICELPLNVWHDVRGSKVKGGDFLRALRDLWRIHRAYGK